jgi:hypothetical protein
MTSKVKGSEGIEFPDGTVQSSAAYSKAESRQGVTDGSNAAAGQIGEYLESTAIFSSSISNNTTGTCGTLALPAGDWDVWGVATLSGASVTGLGRISIGLGNNNLNQITGSVQAQQYGNIAYNSAASSTLSMGTIMTRVSIAASTTINLLQSCIFTGGTLSVSAVKLCARRVR